MKQIKIIGGEPLSGTIRISGAKNSAVALIPAAILCDEEVKISNIPNISDIDALKEILKYLEFIEHYDNNCKKKIIVLSICAVA